jgi:DNA-binding NtrC family response regulator
METNKRPHILIVDDEDSIRLVLSDFLTRKGFETTAVETVLNAQKVLDKGTFDLAILDVHLPDGDGLDLLGEIRHKRPDMPVIILTGMGFQEDLLQKAKELGAKGFVSKMLPVSQVLMEIRHALKIRGT